MAEVLSLTSGNFHILRSIYERMIKVRRLLRPLILHL